MPKKSNKKTAVKRTVTQNPCVGADAYFDSENVKLILLCAMFGAFGVHKFAQHKKTQGIIFILLDITLVGFLVTAIWAFCDLIALTFKKNNKVGNMIVGACCILGNGIFGVPSYLVDSKTFVHEYVDHNENKPEMISVICHGGADASFQADIEEFSGDSLILHMDDDVLALTDKQEDANYYIYRDYFVRTADGFIRMEYSSNPQDIVTVKIPKNAGYNIQISGNILDSYNEYDCVK